MNKLIILSCFLFSTVNAFCFNKDSVQRYLPREQFSLKRKPTGRALIVTPIYSENPMPLTDYLPLSAGSSYPLTGTLYGTNITISESLSANSVYGNTIGGTQVHAWNAAGGAQVRWGSSNYGFAIEQPNDQPAFRLRRADGSTETLQTWDGTGNSSLTGDFTANRLYSTSMQGKQLYLFNSTGGAKTTFTGSNYGFAFEQPNDQPAFRLRRADGSTETLQTWDGTGNSSLAGNLAIGANISSDRLLVNGTVRAKKIITTQNGWSDYVFNDDYKLRSISSLESFIKKNKHLPEIPTTKEVEEKGVSIGDNQALLLKKIEELTLYIIDLKNTTDSQQKEINALKKAIQKK